MSTCVTVENCRIQGCGARIKMAECGAIVDGTPDYTAFENLTDATDFSLSTAAETESFKTIGDCNDQTKVNGRSFSGSFTYYWCATDPIHCAMLEGCSLQFCVVPTGDDPTVVATPAYLGTFVISGMDLPINTGDFIQHTVNFAGDGELLRDNWCTNVIPFAQRFRQRNGVARSGGAPAQALYRQQLAMPSWKKQQKAA